MVQIRIQFHEELARVEEQTLEGLDMVVVTLERTLEALSSHDRGLAEIVVADDDRIDGRYLEVHQSLLSLMALQAPVASDLRLLAALLDVISHVERMGDQCVNIAKLILREDAVPDKGAAIVERIGAMGAQTRRQALQAKRAFAERDVDLAMDLVRQDDEVDSLNRECFRLAVEIGEDPEAREWAMHMMLAARWLERLGDHTVDIGEQAAFLVTGLFYEFSDASHPEAPPRVR